MRLKFARLDIEAGTMWIYRFGLYVPDGLHVWFGSRGVHLFWHGSPHQGRVTFDQARWENGGE